MKMKMTNGRRAAVLTGVLMLSLGGIARATLVEGFESGGFNGGDMISGDVGVRGTYFTIAPSEGTKQMLMTTINNSSDVGYSNQSGNNANSVTTIAAFLGESTSAIHDGIAQGFEGSAFTISLGALNVGDVITLNYDFLTAEDPTGSHHNDFAFWELNSGAIHIFSDVNTSSLHPTDASNMVFGLETGYQTLTITITTAGTYTLGLGVMDATTGDNPSGLLVDNIVVTPVPEPTTVGFTLAGAALLVALRSRIRKTS